MNSEERQRAEAVAEALEQARSEHSPPWSISVAENLDGIQGTNDPRLYVRVRSTGRDRFVADLLGVTPTWIIGNPPIDLAGLRPTSAPSTFQGAKVNRTSVTVRL